MWHNDRSGHLEPSACNYCNYLTSFFGFSYHCIYRFWVLFSFTTADLNEDFCLKLGLGPGG